MNQVNGDYDLLVIGGGVAGLTAGMYGARYGLRTAVIERMMSGNQIINVERIEDFPGFPQGVSGAELGPLMQEQAMNAGARFLIEEVTGLSLKGQHKVVTTYDGAHKAKALIIAAGSTLRTLGLPREEELYGRGLSHCASCDGPFFQDQVVGVVGGGDSAADEALTLTDCASKVLVFHRRNELRAKRVLRDRLLANPKVQIMWSTVVEEVLGEDEVEGVRVKSLTTGEVDQVPLAGLFVYVGLEPNSHFAAKVLKLDNGGHVPVNLRMETEVPGIYAAGDIRQHSAAQLVSAAGDGATAAISAYRYITGKS